VKLNKLLRRVETVSGIDGNVEIKGIASDSRKVKNGYVFEKMGLEVKTRGVDQDRRRVRSLVNSLGLGEGYVITRDFKKKEGFIPASEV